MDTETNILLQRALSGDKQALEDLLLQHQTWVYNVAIHLTADADKAADLMQESLIKVVTHLSKFDGKSAFRTWVYRIIKNHFLNSQRSKYNKEVIPWEEFGNGLDSIPDAEIGSEYEGERKLLVKEAKLSCMKAMLLCLSPEQRMIYVLGELFEFPDIMCSEIMEISRANFRQKLSRARKQLYSFMNQKCGLINQANPCRCARKTTGFIQKGYVDPKRLQFQQGVIARIEEVVEQKLKRFQKEGIESYQQLFQQHDFLEPEDQLASLRKLLSSDAIKETFELN